MSFTVVASVLVVLILGVAFVRTRIRLSRLSRMDWEDLIARIMPVPIDEISIIANDYLHPRKGQLVFDTEDIWAKIGRAEGLRRIYANAEILIALAGYAQRWNPEESLMVVEMMRRDALVLRHSTLRLSFGLTVDSERLEGPFNVQQVASAYYLMRSRVLALYETIHVGRFPQLASLL